MRSNFLLIFRSTAAHTTVNLDELSKVFYFYFSSLFFSFYTCFNITVQLILFNNSILDACVSTRILYEFVWVIESVSFWSEVPTQDSQWYLLSLDTRAPVLSCAPLLLFYCFYMFLLCYCEICFYLYENTVFIFVFVIVTD